MAVSSSLSLSLSWSSGLSSQSHRVGVGLASPNPRRSPRDDGEVGTPMGIVAQKKAKKTRKIILKEDVTELGKKGELVDVKAGFYRNYLLPYGKAQIVTPLFLKEMRIEEERIEAEKKRALIFANLMMRLSFYNESLSGKPRTR